jgi:hypothetical protein
VIENEEKKENDPNLEKQQAPSLARGCLVNTVFSACVGIGLLLAYKAAFSDLDGIYVPIGLGLLLLGSVVIWREWR